jgi:hypothetical protein
MAPLWHYLAYLRPRSFLPTAIFVVTGYALSPARPAEALDQGLDILWLVLVYSVLLWGGANALNSSQDRDEGPVNLLPNPPPLPPGLAAFGLVVSGLAVAAAATRGWRPAVVVLIGFLASLVYSVRLPGMPWRGKEIGGLDILINATGCGLGAVLLGYVATPAPLGWEVVFVGVAFSVAIWGGLPTSQIFQLRPDDTYATARNYTAWLGPRRVLRLGLVFFLAHLAMLTAHALWLRPALWESASAAVPWLGWMLLVVTAALHSFVWSWSPFRDSYARMLRQMSLLLASQILWVIAIWLT